MEEQSNIDWKKPVTSKQLFLFALIFFLVAGFTIGFAIGGYITQKNWEEYNTHFQTRIDQECVCEQRFSSCGRDITLGGKKWLYEK